MDCGCCCYKVEMFLLAFLCVSQISTFSYSAATATGGNDTLVNPTFVTVDDGAVCLTGQPASYFFLKGFGNGTRNWLVFLNGGGWCKNITDCLQYIDYRKIGQDIPPAAFYNHLLLTKRDENPEFFNWNKVSVTYCDGSSFTGNSDITIKNGTTYYFRGARIFKAVMQELLAKGMGSAENVLLAGSSAGGVAATIYCDAFRGYFPSTSRVKCFSDSGYFFLPKHHTRGNKFLSIFEGLIEMHGSTPALPESCTSKFPPAMCFLPQNLQADIQTPIFFLMSAFDTVQINYTLSNEHAVCSKNPNCTSSQLIKDMQELRLEFLDVLREQRNNSQKGVLIYSPFSHALLFDYRWYSLAPGGTKETYDELFRDWYFDRKRVNMIDTYPCPYNCSTSY
ncbi:unnamed protein product [Cuscuta campestris]|uniref:Pectin acetylesterase n=1 Tax=Cuscuta campestris TaxID=132261 RepID=A0A484NI78_9ASTE|nr:unnamed protein product [Cuscuta campestris]